MTPLLRTLTLMLTALLLPTWGAAQDGDTWLAKSDIALRKAAGDQQPVLLQVAAQTPLTRTGQRSGPWTQVRAPGGQVGWVHMFDLHKGSVAPAAAQPAGAGLMRTLTQVGNSAGGSTTSTSLAGIRGLEAEDIRKASPNPLALTQAEKQQATVEQARQFAASARLTARQVDELPTLPLPSVTAEPAPQK